jgi:ABC-type lipoprotein export system ATPase subunit
MQLELNQIKVQLPKSDRVLFRIPKLHIESKAKVLIEGPSGLGKTTLLHLMAGLLLPDEGNLSWNGQNLSSLNEDERSQGRRRKLGLILQKLNLLDHLSALENVRLGAWQASIEECEKALIQLGLEKQMHVRSSLLSLGEQQRVAIARVVAAKPELILADEPTSSLDEENAKHVIEALLNSAKKATLIVVSHDHRIRGHFDRILNIRDWVPR